MYLVWLRVAAVLYAGAGIAAFPTVLYQSPRWKSACVHVGGLAFLFHFVSVVEMLSLAHSWVPMGVREGESLLAWWSPVSSSWCGGSTAPFRWRCLPCRSPSSSS